MRRLILAIIGRGALLLAILVLSPFFAYAQDEGTSSGTQIVIRPNDQPDGSRFEATVNPGETVGLTATLMNMGDTPIELRTYTANVVPAVNGGLKLSDRNEEKSGVSAWLNYQTEEFTLQPGEEREKPLIISVPERSGPGQYVSAVALETVNPVDDDDDSMFTQYFRKVVSVYITVPGDMIHDFETGDPEILVVSDMSVIQIPIINTGNVRIDIEGEIQLIDSDGNLVYEGTVRTSPIYNGQETIIQVSVSTALPEGEYLVVYQLTEFTSEVVRSEEGRLVTAEQLGTLSRDPIAFDNISIESNADPIIFANVSVDVVLTQSSFRSTRLTLVVFHEGELVEEFVLAENLSLTSGPTTIAQRYLPATNWESGTYIFSLKLESTEGESTSLLLEEEDVATLEVP